MVFVRVELAHGNVNVSVGEGVGGETHGCGVASGAVNADKELVDARLQGFIRCATAGALEGIKSGLGIRHDVGTMGAISDGSFSFAPCARTDDSVCMGRRTIVGHYDYVADTVDGNLDAAIKTEFVDKDSNCDTKSSGKVTENKQTIDCGGGIQSKNSFVGSDSSGGGEHKEGSGCAGNSVNTESQVGARTLRNRHKRHVARQKKKNQKSNFVKVVPERIETVRQGYFSTCEKDVQEKLKESYARRLIAENERRAAEEAAKVKKMNSPEALMRSLAQMLEVANKLKVNAKDHAVAGWAKTVADSAIKSASESAPSSVPSLEEVGWGKSALESSDGSDDKVKRVLEYESAKTQLELDIDNMGSYRVGEPDKMRKELAEEFADVTMTIEQQVKLSMRDKLWAQFAGRGIEEVEQIFDDLGVPYIPEDYYV